MGERCLFWSGPVGDLAKAHRRAGCEKYPSTVQPLEFAAEVRAARDTLHGVGMADTTSALVVEAMSVLEAAAGVVEHQAIHLELVRERAARRASEHGVMVRKLNAALRLFAMYVRCSSCGSKKVHCLVKTTGEKRGHVHLKRLWDAAALVRKEAGIKDDDGESD